MKTGKMIMMETLEDVSTEESAKGLVPLERLEKVQEDLKASYAWVKTSAEADRKAAIEAFEKQLAAVAP